MKTLFIQNVQIIMKLTLKILCITVSVEHSIKIEVVKKILVESLRKRTLQCDFSAVFVS